MHFVAALDDVPAMRACSGPLRGVVTGAADGYGRMAGRPAATLLHLGPGLGNGIANLHNARRARTPIVNVVGDHATTHLAYDPPLAVGHREPGRARLALVPLVRPRRRGWRATPSTPWPVRSALPAAWPRWSCPPTRRGRSRRRPASSRHATGRRSSPSDDDRGGAAKALRSGEPPVLLVGGNAVRARAASPRPAGSPRRPGPSCYARRSRPGSSGGTGRAAVDRLGYLAEIHQAQLDGAPPRPRRRPRARVVLRLPRHPGYLVPGGCRCTHSPARATTRRPALEALADAAGRPAAGASPAPSGRPDRPTGASQTRVPGGGHRGHSARRGHRGRRGQHVGPLRRRRHRGCPRHDWLCLTGGAIGQGLPVATGAAVACPGPPGAVPRGRRQRDVHAAVAVDPSSGGSRRHHHRPVQQRSYAILNMELTGSVPTPAARWLGGCSTSPSPSSTSAPWPAAWACPHDAWRTPRTS